MPNTDRILAVDDNPTNLAILQELFESDYSFRAVTSGEEALRVAPQFKPDLIFLDIMMYGRDGYETCQLLRKHPQVKHSRIVMVSSRVDVDSRLKAYEAGADDYITKPFDNNEVTAKVTVWLRQHSECEVRRLIDEVESARDALSDTLMSMVGFKRVESGKHLFRIRWYTQAIAEQLSIEGPYVDQIKDNFLRNLHRSSPLHDIGMINVSEDILLKLQKLSTDEMNQVKRHCEDGADLLAEIMTDDCDEGFLQMAVNIAKYHHERFDGRGYPAGLVGEKIPLEARIVAVADVFDALTAERVYRSPLGFEDAIATIHAEAGKQLDPVVVEALNARTDDFREAHERFTNSQMAPTLSLWEEIDPTNGEPRAQLFSQHVY